MPLAAKRFTSLASTVLIVSEHKFCIQSRTHVGAGLLAKASGQTPQTSMLGQFLKHILNLLRFEHQHIALYRIQHHLGRIPDQRPG